MHRSGWYSAADITAIAAEMDQLKVEGLRHHASYRDRNLVYVLRPHPTLGRHLRFIHWLRTSAPYSLATGSIAGSSSSWNR